MPTEEDEIYEEEENDGDDDDSDKVEYITHVVTSDPWTNFRNTLAQTMFNNWRVRNRG